ncbi:hypothetical protein Vretimale_18175, partial [Volvox reticuliferus]
IDHQKWFTSNLDAKQMKYGALDAFVSYAAGVRVLQRPGYVPRPKPYDLTLPSVSELLLAPQWVLTSQLLDANRPSRTKHDFYDAKFVSQKKQGLVLLVTMSRFKTRLRRDAGWSSGCCGTDAASAEYALTRMESRPLWGRCDGLHPDPHLDLDLDLDLDLKGEPPYILRRCLTKFRTLRMQELKDTLEAAACQELLR